MKRIFIYLLILILISFAIPIIFTSKFGENKETSSHKINQEDKKIEENENISKENENNNSKAVYDYKKYNIVKVLHAKDNNVEEMELDTYLYGVVSAEMPVSFEKEALKAQAVVARTYTIYKITNSVGKHEGADICDNSNCCQAWISKENRFSKWEGQDKEENWNKIVSAVEETKGKIVTYQGEAINAFFHSNSGGTTEAPVNVWGGSGYPYLQAVQTAGEDGYSQYYSEVTLSKDELTKKMRNKYSDFSINFEDEGQIKVIEHTEGGRVKTIKIGNKNLSGVEARSMFGLKSANFEIKREGDKIKFTVIGYGHGVGMSQTGADSMAKSGSSYEDIIKHFYTGVEITDL